MNMEVVVGTYEELILGYKIVASEEGYEFELSFTDHSHIGCVRSVAVSKRGILASGSSDQMIRLFNLKKHFEIGSLMHHNDYISSLTFHGKTHMFSSSHDGTIGVWQVGKWECLRTLRGHKSAVHSVAAHPTGKMALSVSQDKSLRIWNLMTGKCAYVTMLKQDAHIVLWSPGGSTYIVVTNNRADVYEVETAKVCHTIQTTGRIQAVHFLDADTLVLGGDEGQVEIHNIETKTKNLEFSTETNRVKGLGVCQPPDEEDILLITASSDGFIKLWKLHQNDSTWSCSAVGQIQTKFRLTCAALYAPKPVKVQEKKIKESAGLELVDEELKPEPETSRPNRQGKPSPRKAGADVSPKNKKKRKYQPECHEIAERTSKSVKVHKDMNVQHKSPKLKRKNGKEKPTNKQFTTSKKVEKPPHSSTKSVKGKLKKFKHKK